MLHKIFFSLTTLTKNTIEIKQADTSKYILKEKIQPHY